MLALSKMKYGIQFCFKDNLKTLNQIQIQFCKRFCHLKLTTPNYCIKGEFGVEPIEFHFYKAALTFWTKFIGPNVRSMIKTVYQIIDKNMEDNQFIEIVIQKKKIDIHVYVRVYSTFESLIGLQVLNDMKRN